MKKPINKKSKPFIKVKFVDAGKNIPKGMLKPRIIHDECDKMSEGLGITEERVAELTNAFEHALNESAKKAEDHRVDVIQALVPVFEMITHPNELFYIAFATALSIVKRQKESKQTEIPQEFKKLMDFFKKSGGQLPEA